MRMFTPLAALLSLLPVSVLAVEVDGRIDPAEWQGARHITDFRQVQPLSRAPASLQTEAWVLATPEGLAVAFHNVQPASVPRTLQRVQRDFDAQVDRVNLMVGFDAAGGVGYDFTVASTGGIADAVITNESNFNDDWDGNWQHAVRDTAEGWDVELLIPWHIASMAAAQDGQRTLRLYLDRVIGSTGERAAWPAVSLEKPRFLSDFERVEVPAYSQSLLVVTPYVSALHDNVGGRDDFEAGADLFWKPSGQFQLAATVNPDFGQVESDDLVVNFSATETFVSDKRPFFTENQGLFDYSTPSDFSQLLYTRRIGAPADDGSGAADISAALKLTGNAGGTRYGLFLADEDGAAGRDFRALRLVRDFSTQNLGLMLTQVERPWLDREAEVLGIDHDWRPTPRWNVRTRVFGSHIAQAGETTSDSGATLWADYEMDHGWRQQWIAMHFGNDLQINDAGYLARNSTNYLHWELRRRFAEQPEASRYSSKEWRWRAVSSRNDHGEKLGDQVRISREGRLRDGSYEYAQVLARGRNVDDLLTRGHGSVQLPWRWSGYYEYERPRKGRWAHTLEAELLTGGLAGTRKLGYALDYTATYFVNDGFSLYAGAYADQTPDWLVWQRDTLVGSYRGREWHLDAGLDWTISERQELRIKLQSVAVDARARQAWRIAPDGRAIASDERIDDFSVANLGFQIRYRYELAPLSYLYVVYGRGGYDEFAYSDEAGGLLRESFGLRDDEQLLVKLSYRFER